MKYVYILDSLKFILKIFQYFKEVLVNFFALTTTTIK